MMARLPFVDRAKSDLAEVAAHIERESADRERAEEFLAKLMAHCQRLAGLNVPIG